MESIPKRYAIVRANQYMIRTCAFLIAYSWHYLGGSGNLVEYARKWEAKGLIHIENLAEQKPPDAF